MADLGSEILKKYGTAAVIFGVIAAVIIWALAHFAAEPGKEVSAIWGLANYTKDSKVINAKLDSLNKKISILEAQLAEEQKKAKSADLMVEQNTKLKTQIAEALERAERAENKAGEVGKLTAKLSIRDNELKDSNSKITLLQEKLENCQKQKCKEETTTPEIKLDEFVFIDKKFDFQMSEFFYDGRLVMTLMGISDGCHFKIWSKFDKKESKEFEFVIDAGSPQAVTVGGNIYILHFTGSRGYEACWVRSDRSPPNP